MREVVRGEGDEAGGQGPGDAMMGEEGAAILATYRQIASGELEAMPCKLPEVSPALPGMKGPCAGAGDPVTSPRGAQSHACSCGRQGIVLGRAAACHVARFVFKRSALGKGGPAMLKWIIDMLDRGKQVISVHCCENAHWVRTVLTC